MEMIPKRQPEPEVITATNAADNSTVSNVSNVPLAPAKEEMKEVPLQPKATKAEKEPDTEQKLQEKDREWFHVSTD